MPDVAELSLLGGLGCGRALVERALQKCRRQGYRFVVLQSTKLAVAFYESRGFRRLGAVARYHDRPELPEIAHRHWTDRVDQDEPS